MPILPHFPPPSSTAAEGSLADEEMMNGVLKYHIEVAAQRFPIQCLHIVLGFFLVCPSPFLISGHGETTFLSPAPNDI